MRLLELTATAGGVTINVRFHTDLTVIGSLDAGARQEFIDHLDRAAAGSSPGAELHYRDRHGRHLIVTRVAGRRRFLATEPATGHRRRIPLPPPDDVPRTARIDARGLSAGVADLTVPQRLDLMVDRLGRARHQGRGGLATVGMLDEPFTGMPEGSVRTLLDAVERLGRLIQIVYLTADPLVLAWASVRDAERALRYVPAGVLTT